MDQENNDVQVGAEDQHAADLQDQQTDTGAQQNDPARFTKRINEKHYQLEQEKRAREAVEAELQKLQQSQQARRPETPPLPDPYDDNFDSLMAQRDAAIAQQAKFDADQQVRQAQQHQHQQQLQAQQQEQLRSQVQKYSTRAAELGVSAEELQTAGGFIQACDVDPQVQYFILQDDQGPLITSYLARNPEEIEKIRGMDPMSAAVHITTYVKSKAAALRKGEGAPPPADTLGGGGAPPTERGPKGARYE